MTMLVQMMLNMNRILTSLLLLVVTSAAALDASSADYESKIQAALNNYAAHSEEILQRAIKLGNDGTVVETVEIDANGDILPSTSAPSSAALYADFGLNAVTNNLNNLQRYKMAKVDFMSLTKGEKNKEDIPYATLNNWSALSEDLSDKDFHKFWKEAVGEDVVKGVMNYEQFLVFYDIVEEWLERDSNDDPADVWLEAAKDHLSTPQKSKKRKGAFKQLAAQNNNDDSTISYAQLEKWEEIAHLTIGLNDGEFLSLWQEATGSESQESEGQMKLSQFVTFNDLLDKLLMAKVDFMTLIKGGEEKISFDQLWNMDALSDFMHHKVFHELWKDSTGERTKKGFMNYEQFLVFYELASEWLEHEYGTDDKLSDEGEDDDDEEDDDSSDDDDSGDEDDVGDDEDDKPQYYRGLKISYYGKDLDIDDEDLPDDLKADLESADEDIRIEAKVRRRLDPENWGEFSYWTLHAYFACEKMFSSPRPLWTDKEWRDMRDFYHEFIEEDKEDEDGPEGLHSYQLSEDEYDLTQNAIPFQSGEKGRGLQAVRDIQAGELVFKATNNTIVFNYGHTWRKFLFAVNERFGDPGMTCDILVWSWVQDLVDDGPMKVVMDLDSGSLLNEGRDGVAGWDAPNAQCGKPDATRCDMDYFAFRDIKEGEELLIDYREFAFMDSWPAMGL